jgi:hypothetical protein
MSLQRALGLSETAQLLPLIATHLSPEPYSLEALASPECFGVHPNTLFEGESRNQLSWCSPLVVFSPRGVIPSWCSPLVVFSPRGVLPSWCSPLVVFSPRGVLFRPFANALLGVHTGDRKRVGALEVLGSGSTEGFFLQRRARHVASEAARVWQFRAVCEGAPSAGQLAELGV